MYIYSLQSSLTDWRRDKHTKRKLQRSSRLTALPNWSTDAKGFNFCQDQGRLCFLKKILYIKRAPPYFFLPSLTSDSASSFARFARTPIRRAHQSEQHEEKRGNILIGWHSPLRRIFSSLMGSKISLILYTLKRWMFLWRDTTNLGFVTDIFKQRQFPCSLLHLTVLREGKEAKNYLRYTQKGFSLNYR